MTSDKKNFLKKLSNFLSSGVFYNFIRLAVFVLFSVVILKISLTFLQYSFDRLKGYGVYFEGFEIRPGNLFEVDFKGIRYKKEKFSFYGKDGKLVINIFESFKERKPVFETVSLGSFKIKFYESDKRKSNDGFQIPQIKKLPFTFSAKKIYIGKGEVVSSDFNLEMGGFDYKLSHFNIKPVGFCYKNRIFKISGISGIVEKESIVLKPFELISKDILIKIHGKLGFQLKKTQFSIEGKIFDYPLNLSFRKEGNNLNCSGNVEILKLKENLRFTLNAKVLEDVDFNGSIKTTNRNIKTEFSGMFDGKRLDLQGALGGSALNEVISIKEMETDYRISGYLGDLNYSFKGKIGSVSFSKNSRIFNDVGFMFDITEGDKLKGNIFWEGVEKGAFFVSGSIRRKDFTVNGTIKNFELKKEPVISVYSPEIKEWIPDIFGDIYVAASINSGKIKKFKFNFDVKEFAFRGFKATGFIEADSDDGLSKDIPLKGKLEGDNGSLSFDGYFDFQGKFLNLSLNAKKFLLSSFDFLKKEGVSGIVNGKGEIYGKLNNISGNLTFLAPEFSYFGERFNDVKGSVLFSYPSIFIKGKSEDGRLNVSKVAINFSPGFSIDVAGSVKNSHLLTVEEILKRYKIENPVKLEGVASGDFSVSFRHGTENPVKFDVFVTDFDGHYQVPGVVSGNATGKGKVAFDKRFILDLKGSAGDTLLSGLSFNDGFFNLTIDGENLSVKGEKFKSTLFDKANTSFDVSVELKKQLINGDFNFSGEKNLDFLSLKTDFKGKITGGFKNFSIPVSGKLKLLSPYVKEASLIDFKGEITEPDNKGNFSFSSSQVNLSLSLDGQMIRVNGQIKDLQFPFEKGKAALGLGFIDLKIPEFDLDKLAGNINVPVLSVKYDNYPEIYTVSGVFAKLDGMNLEVRDAGFAFEGGSFTVRDITVNREEINGELSGSVEGMFINRFLNMKDIFSIVSGDIDASTKFSYKFEKKALNYSASVVSNRIECYAKYILGKMEITDLGIGIKDGKPVNLLARILVSGGNVVVSGKDSDIISISLFNIPIGEAGIWRAKVTGNLKYDGKKIDGGIAVSRPLILKIGSNKRESSSVSLPFDADVNINFTEPLVIKTEIWKATILPSLKFTTRDFLPVISGNFFILNGNIKYMGKDFEIGSGSGVINNLFTVKGTLNIVSSTEIGDYLVYMFVRGSLSSPVLYFSSEPPLSKEQILSLIMTGATPSDMERSNELFPVVQVAYYASSLVLKPIEKQFSKIFKLETFRVEPYITRYGETVLKLSLSKRLGDRLRIVGYQTTGQDSEFSLGFQYFVGKYKNLYFEYLYSNYYANEYGIGFEVRVDNWEDLKKMRLRK